MLNANSNNALPNARTTAIVGTQSPRLTRGSMRIAMLQNVDWGGMCAIADQTVVSGTRFLVTILVGRLCGPGDLGIYVLAFAPLVLSGCLFEALVTTPFIVLGARMPTRQRQRYAAVSLVLGALVAAFAMLVVVAIAGGLFLWSANPRLAQALLVASVCIPFTLLLEFTRRYAFAHVRFHEALALDVTATVLQLSTLALLVFSQTLSPYTALAGVGVSAAGVGGMWLWLHRDLLTKSLRGLRRYGQHNWSFGKWLAASQLTGSVHGHSLHWLLVAFTTTIETGLFAASQTLFLLSNPLLLGSRNALGARAAVAYAEGGPASVRALIHRAAAILLGLQATFTIVLVVGAGPIVKLIFGKQFEAQPAIVALIGCCTLAWAVNVASSSAVVAMRRSDVGFRSAVLGLLTTLGTGVLLIPYWGGLGAACALLCGSLVATVIQWLIFLRLTGECEGEVAA